MRPDDDRWRVRPPVASTEARDARAFLDLVDPRTSAIFDPGSPGSYVEPEWLFRGAGDARHALLPKALREGARFWTGRSLEAPPPARTHREQVWREASTVRQLLARADRHGLPVPGDHRALRHVLEAFAPDGGPAEIDVRRAGAWPPAEVLPLLALAQHHGLATRLLDWTYSPFVAAYFAAREGAAAHARGARGKLCTWFTTRRLVNAASEAPGPLTMRIVTVPTVTDENLRAQEGLFIATGAAEVDADAAVSFPSMDAVFAALEPALRAALRMPGGARWLPLARVDLDLAHAPALLRLLSDLGFTAARLFPGLGGVVDSMCEAALCQAEPPRRARAPGSRRAHDRREGEGEAAMPWKTTVDRARKDLRAGKRPTTAAGAFVKEEMEHVKRGKHGVRSRKQAIAIGLSKARRSGVPLPPRGERSAPGRTAAKRTATRRRPAKGKVSASRTRASRPRASRRR